MKTIRTLVASCASWLLLCIALFGAVSLRAQTNVLTNADADVLQAELNLGGTVILNFNGTITTSTTFNIQTDVILETLTNDVTISGGGTTRLFVVQPGVNFQVQNLTMSGGRRAGTSGATGAHGANHSFNRGGDGGAGGAGGTANGGAIYNMGTTLAINCLFLTNSVAGGSGGTGGVGGSSSIQPGDGGNGGNGGTAFGGAVYNLSTFTASNCTFSGNSAVGGNGGVGGTAGTNGPYAYNGGGGFGATAGGAALYNDAGASATILACTFSFNFSTGGNSQAAPGSPDNGNGQSGPVGASARGGAIYNASPNQNIVVNSTFYDNLVSGGSGGNGANAVFGAFAGIGGNGGNGFGGSVFNDATGDLAVTNCTFDAGQAFGGTNGVNGTGAYTNGSPTAGAGYGANIANKGGTFVLQNSILAYPTNANNAYGSIYDGGFNISSDNTPVFNNTGSRNSVDPLLGPLANNGGPTQTVMPAANSPAVGAIPGDGIFPPFDQRGVTRPIGPNADIGAVERGGMLSGTVTFGTNDLAGVNIIVTNQSSSLSATTDSSGNYALALPAGIYTVTPQFDDYLFSPSNSDVTVSVTNFVVANFAVAQNLVTGTVTMDSNGLANVTVTAAGTNSNSFTATTDSSGNYSLNLPKGTGTYTITPALANLVFSPSNATVTVSNSSSSTNSTNVNFTTTPPAFFSGEVPLSNDYFWLQFTNSTSTNVFGYYTFTDFPIFYHTDLGFEYFFDDTNDAGGAYLYDYSSEHFFYTARTLWPYLYDFNLNVNGTNNLWLYYWQNANYTGQSGKVYRFFSIVGTTNVITE